MMRCSFTLSMTNKQRRVMSLDAVLYIYARLRDSPHQTQTKTIGNANKPGDAITSSRC